jgi:hypothetical protein
MFLFPPLSIFTGVKSIDANVEAKTVIVEADESVSAQVMLEKLQKVDSSCDVECGRSYCDVKQCSSNVVIVFSFFPCSGPQPLENQWPCHNRWAITNQSLQLYMLVSSTYSCFLRK